MPSTTEPDPDPFDFIWGHRASRRCDYVDVDGVHHPDGAALMKDHHQPLPEELCHQDLKPDDLFYGGRHRYTWTRTSFGEDDSWSDADNMPALVNISVVYGRPGIGKSIVQPALLRRPKRPIHLMPYRHPAFAGDSYCRDHDFWDHVRSSDLATHIYSLTSQQTARMAALLNALRVAENRLMPKLSVDQPSEQGPSTNEEGLTNSLIALAELTATAAANLLLLASTFEAMPNICYGLQGPVSGGSSKNLAPAQLRQGVQEQPTGSCPSPSWQLPLPLSMAA